MSILPATMGRGFALSYSRTSDTQKSLVVFLFQDMSSLSLSII